jgi:hypothetical protein
VEPIKGKYFTFILSLNQLMHIPHVIVRLGAISFERDV